MNNQFPKIFGIDLGTTYSCIAYVDQYRQPVIISDSKNKPLTPSVVFFDGTEKSVGENAQNNAKQHPEHVVEVVKRHIGKSKEDWSFAYAGTKYSAEDISAVILNQLTTNARQSLKTPVKDVVITVPAYFGIAEREATKRAGELAGLNVRAIINEPTAAAILYAQERYTSQYELPDETVLVYDLGGGTFDISIIKISQQDVTVVVTGGDRLLGGRDWDEVLVKYSVGMWQKRTGLSDDPRQDPATKRDLWTQAENAKRSLSVHKQISVTVSHANRTRPIMITRDKFNELTKPLLERTIAFTRETMELAKTRQCKNFTKILLVGGSTRMPQVQEKLEQAFPHIPVETYDPDEAVAKGAALYAWKLAIDEKINAKMAENALGRIEGIERNKQEEEAIKEVAREYSVAAEIVRKTHQQKVINVTSHSFGIITLLDRYTDHERKGISNLVITNTPLPADTTETFYTVENNQQAVSIEIMETRHTSKIVEQEDYSERNKIGGFLLESLPSGLPENSPLEVHFQIDQYGLLQVSAREISSGIYRDIEVRTSDMVEE